MPNHLDQSTAVQDSSSVQNEKLAKDGRGRREGEREMASGGCQRVAELAAPPSSSMEAGGCRRKGRRGRGLWRGSDAAAPLPRPEEGLRPPPD